MSDAQPTVPNGEMIASSQPVIQLCSTAVTINHIYAFMSEVSQFG